MSLFEVTTENFDKEVLQAAGKVLVDFWAPWCRPCRMQTPILENIAESGEKNTRIVKLNTDENGPIAQKYGIMSIPTLILFEDGKEIARFEGVQPEEVLKSRIS
jgi:thioredoxin 1